MSETGAEISLERVAELLVDEQQREQFYKWLEEQAGEWTGKPWLGVAGVKGLKIVLKKLLARIEELSQEKIQEHLKNWKDEKGIRGRLTRLVIRVAGWFLGQREKELTKLLDELDRVLKGKREPSTPEIALVVRQMVALEEVREELGQRLEGLLKAVEALYPELPLVEWDERFDPDSRVGSMLLHTPLVGREEELDRLKRFLEAEPQPFFVLSAGGGTGKTKLALELCRWADERGWKAFFVSKSPFFDQWGKVPVRAKGLLLVVDYALSHPLRGTLAEAVQLRRLRAKVLFLEREGWAEQVVGSLVGGGLTRSEALAKDCPYHLQALRGAPGRELFKKVAKREPEFDLDKELGGNPLLIILAAQMGSRGAAITRDEVLDYYLNFFYRAIEKDEKQEEKERLIILALIATLVRGIGHKDIDWLFSLREEFPLPSDKKTLRSFLRKARAALLEVVSPGEEGGLLPGMQPDLAAAAFLAREYLRKGDMEKRTFRRHVEALLPHRPKDVVQTLVLAVRDLPEEEARHFQEVCSQVWNWLHQQQPSEQKGEYLLAMAALLAGPQLVPPPYLPKEWFAFWLEVKALEPEAVVALAQLALACGGEQGGGYPAPSGGASWFPGAGGSRLSAGMGPQCP